MTSRGRIDFAIIDLNLPFLLFEPVDHIADERIENCGENLRHEHENTDNCDVRAENRSVKLRLI